jgi:hypothetical protein
MRAFCTLLGLGGLLFCHLHEKYIKVMHQLYRAAAGDPNRFYVNYLSGSGAWGTSKRTVGIIMADFPGESLIANIIANNHHVLHDLGK